MKKWIEFMGKAPVLKTLSVCPVVSRRNARIELMWTVGFALIVVPIVIMIVLFSRPINEMPGQVFDVIGRGEIMIYAASVCGAALYSIRHGFEGPIPESLRSKVTPLGTLTVCITILLALALGSYVVRRMGDINHIDINHDMLNVSSVIVLFLSLTFAYVVLSLKFALRSGAVPASHEQTINFGKKWEEERDA